MGSKLILSDNHSRAPLWVRETFAHCETSSFDNHFDYCFIVLKDIQHSTGTRMRCIGWNVINVCWNDVGVLDGVMHVWLDNCRRVSMALSWVHLFCSVRNEILQSPNPRE